MPQLEYKGDQLLDWKISFAQLLQDVESLRAMEYEDVPDEVEFIVKKYRGLMPDVDAYMERIRAENAKSGIYRDQLEMSRGNP